MKDIVKRPEIQKQSTEIDAIVKKCDIQFTFTNLSSKAWKDNRAIIQRRADVFAYSPNKTEAYAGFNLTTATASKIMGVYLRIYTWKTVSVHVLGTDAGLMEEINGWMHCLLLAFESGHPETYCVDNDYDPLLHANPALWVAHQIHPEDPKFETTSITLPCKNTRWVPDVTHPETYRQEYMQAAQKTGCNKCPLFSMGKFCTHLPPDMYSKPAINHKK